MTTIVLVRKNNEVVVAGDGQVSMGNTVVKSTASKVRKIEKRDVVAGFAGSTADALTLFERLEGKLEKHAGNLSRAAVELAKDWRTDKYLRRLEALMAVGDKSNSFLKFAERRSKRLRNTCRSACITLGIRCFRSWRSSFVSTGNYELMAG